MNRLKLSLLAVALPALFACSDSSDRNTSTPPVPQPEPPPAVEPAQLRVTHASPDAPDVNVYIDGDLALERVPFRASSGLLTIEDPDSLEVEVRAILPDDSEVSVIGPVSISLQPGARTDVVAYDTVFDANGDLNIKASVLDPVTVEEGIQDVRVSVLHAAGGVGPVDVYVTAPGDMLASSTPLDLAFEQALPPTALMADTPYRIRITPDGSDSVVYDSGTLELAGGTELLLIAVNNTYGVGDNPVNLLAVGPESANELLDPGMGAAVRVVHNSADTPAVDVIVEGTTVLDAVTFPNASSYGDLTAPAGTYNVVVAADADNSIAPIDADLTLENAQSYSVLAIGSLAANTVEAFVTNDDRRKLATAAKLEVIHGSSIVAGEIPVDVYLTSDGVIADAEPVISELAYPGATGQLAVKPGDYWVTVTAAGDKSVVAFDSGGQITLEAGVNYTAIARDPSAAEVSGNPLVQLTLLAD